MNATEYNLTDTAEDFLAFAGEFEDEQAAMREAQAAEYDEGFLNGMGSLAVGRYPNPLKGAAYIAGYEDGQKEWIRDCA